MWYIYTVEYYSAIKKNKIMPFVATWMDPRDVWSKSDRERQISYDISYMWNLKTGDRDFPGGTVVKNPPANAGTWVRALVREDTTCHGATKPMCHNYWACVLEPACHNYWSPHTYSLCSATREATAVRSPHTTTKSSPCSPQLEKACTQQRRPNAAKNK